MDYENMFWDMYNDSYEMGMKMEGVMDDLGIEFKEESDGTCSLTPEEYKNVVLALDGKKPLSNSEFIENLVCILSDYFDSTYSFEEVGMLTMNNGIVVKHNGKEYQLALLGSTR